MGINGPYKTKINKASLFFHLVIALMISLLFSALLQDFAYEAKQQIWLNYIEDKQQLYEFQNAYSEKFGELPSIPSVNKRILSTTDKWLVEMLDWIQTWSMFFISSLFLLL